MDLKSYGLDENLISYLNFVGIDKVKEENLQNFLAIVKVRLDCINRQKNREDFSDLLKRFYLDCRDAIKIISQIENHKLKPDEKVNLFANNYCSKLSLTVNNFVLNCLKNVVSHEDIFNAIKVSIYKNNIVPSFLKDEITLSEKIKIVESERSGFALNLFSYDELLDKRCEELIKNITKDENVFSNKNTCQYLNENLLSIFLKSYPECFDNDALIFIMNSRNIDTTDILFRRESFKKEYIQNFNFEKMKKFRDACYGVANYYAYEQFANQKKSFIDECVSENFDELVDKTLFDNLKDNTKKERVKASLQLFFERFAFDTTKNATLNLQTIYEFITKSEEYRNELGENVDIIRSAYLLSQDVMNENLKESQKLDRIKYLYDKFLNKNINLEQVIYSSLATGKEMFMNEIVRKETKPNELDYKNFSMETKNKEALNSRFHAFMGDKFTFVVHCSNFSKYYEPEKNYKKSWIDASKKGNVISFSLINNKRMDIYDKTCICFAFSNLDPKLLMHACVVDSFSILNENELKNRGVSLAKLDLGPIDDFIANMGRSFNELVYAGDKKHSKKTLLPSAVICFDVPTENEIRASMDFNIPIVYIEQQKYYNLVSNSNRSVFQFDYTFE